MARTVVYRDESYPPSWIANEWSNKIVDYLKDKEFDERNGKELRTYLRSRLKDENAHESVVVFSQDMMPDTVLSGLNSPNDLIRRYLNAGGRVIWIGDIPFWSKAHPKSSRNEREEIWQYGTPYAMLCVEQLIAEASSPCEWVEKWDEKTESSWRSRRPANIEEHGRRLNLEIEPLAYAEVTLLPCSHNVQVITRWKKTGTKVGSFGLEAFGFGGNVTLTEEFPEELSLNPQNLACAWHISFNKEYPKQGFYRFWDCGTSDERTPPKNLLKDIHTLATLDLEQ